MATETGKKEYLALLNRTEGYAEQVRKLFAGAVNDILALTSSVPHLDEGEVFRYSEQKKIAKKVSDRLRNLHSAVYAAIKNDIALEWDEANTACDELAASCFGKEILSDKRFAGWFERNTEAMEAFISRSEAGLNLSDRIWQPVKQLRSEMELAMTVAIGDGDSASQISRYVRQYLNNPDKLFRRIRDDKGNLKLSKAAKAYHPGQGVYRSSAKNAMRIARTETNIAYRRADNTRWQQMDFVIGQEINLSRNHPVTDICDTLAGRYPKNFVFDGWHPQCFCYVVPILLSEKDMMAMQQAKLNGEDYDISGKVIADMPGNFKSWAIDNAERIEKAKERGTLPYFIRNNKKTVDRIINPPTALETAKERHAARTPEQIQDIKRRWTLRNAEIRHANRTPEQEAAIRKAWNERRATRKYGQSILSYMGGISDVDTSALQKALNGGNTETILKEARKLKAVGKEILSYSYLDNPMQVARQFSMSEAKAVNEAVQKKLDSWAGLSLEKQKSKLSFEIDWVQKHQKYSTWEVAQNAYKKQLEKVSDALDWENISNEFKNISSFKTKSQPYLDLVAKLQDAISSKDKAAAQQTILDIKKKREQLDKAAAQRNAKRLFGKGQSTTFDESAYTKDRKDKAIWCKTSSNSVNKFKDKADEIYNTASKEEQDAAWRYTSGSGYVNRPLRGYDGAWGKSNFKGIGNVPLDNESPLAPKDIDSLTNLINKSTYDKDIWLQRGVDDEGLAGFLQLASLDESSLNALVGKSITDTAFMSCGAAKGTGFGGNIINIYCPKGTKMLYIDGRSAYSSENEMLIQRNTRFRITKVEKSGWRYFIDVEVVGQI